MHLGDAGHPVGNIHQLDACRTSAVYGDAVHRHTDDDAAFGDHHDLIVILDRLHAHEKTGSFVRTVADDALAASVLYLEGIKRRSLADAILGDKQKIGTLDPKLHADNLIILAQTNAVYTGSAPPGGTDVFFVEPDRISLPCCQEDILIAVRELNLDQIISLSEGDGCQAVLSDMAESSHAGLFYQALLRRHEDIMFIVEFPDRDDRRDLLFRLQLEEIDDGGASGRTAGLRDLVGFQPVDPSHVRKEHQEIVGHGHEQLLDIIVLDGLHALDSLAAPVLGTEVVRGHPLDIAKLCHGDDGVYPRDHILSGNIKLVIADSGAAVVAIFVSDLLDLIPHDTQQHLAVRQDAPVLQDLCL